MGILDIFKRRTGVEFPYVPRVESLETAHPIYLNMENLFHIYHTIPHVKIAINALASMTSNGIYKVVKDGEWVENHPLTNTLMTPNFIQQTRQFIFNYTVNKHVYGSCFLYMNRKAFGDVQSLFVMPSENVRIEFSDKLYNQLSMSDLITSLEIDNIEYDVKDISILKENDDKLILGEPKLKTLQQQIANIKYAYDSRNVNLTQRGATGILSLGDQVTKDGFAVNSMSPKEKKAIEEDIRKKYGIGKSQKQTLVTSLNAKFVPMTFPTKDLMLFEEIEDDCRVILDTFGLNDNLFSKVKSSTFNNVDSSLKRTYQDTIIPNANIDSGRIGKDSGMLNDGEVLTMDFSHLSILQEDEKVKFEKDKVKVDTLNMLLRDGVISLEEYRVNIPESILIEDSFEFNRTQDEGQD